MGDLFDIGKAGINAYKDSLAATGQNIANVGTEGYARRDATIEEVSVASADILTISNKSGLGVRMSGITRSFDQFLDLQLQQASSSFSFSILPCILPGAKERVNVSMIVHQFL